MTRQSDVFFFSNYLQSFSERKMTTSDHRHSNHHHESNNGHDNHSRDDEIDSGKHFSLY
jgi:hypothetical protein